MDATNISKPIPVIIIEEVDEPNEPTSPEPEETFVNGNNDTTFTADDEENKENEVEELIIEEVLSEEQIRKCQSMYFEVKDKALGGITVTQLGKILRAIGCTPTKKELENFMTRRSLLGNGVLTLEEVFVAAARQVQVAPVTNDEALSALNWLHSNYPNTKRLVTQLMTLSEALSLPEASMLVAVGDPGHTGTFNLSNIVDMLKPPSTRKKSKKVKGKGKKKIKKKTKKGKLAVKKKK